MLTWERGGDGWVYAFTTGFQRAQGLVLTGCRRTGCSTSPAWQTWGFDDDGWALGQARRRSRCPAASASCRCGGSRTGWVLALFDDGGYCMDVLALDSPVADLHGAPRATVLRGCSWDDEDHAAGLVAQLYGGYILPGSTLADLHLVVSQWNTATNWPYHAMQFRADVSALAVPDIPR